MAYQSLADTNQFNITALPKQKISIGSSEWLAK